MYSTFHQLRGEKGRAGFTILELLVATAVTVVLAGILLAMTTGILRAWNSTSGSLSTSGQAQLIFGMLQEDLQSALYRNDGGVWLAVDVLNSSTSIANREWTESSGTNNIKPDGPDSQMREEEKLANCRYGLGGSWLRFFSASGGGEPRAIAYQLARRHVTGDPRDAANPADVRYMLYRTHISSNDTYEDGYNLYPGPMLSGPEANYNAPSHPIRVPPRGEIIGNNVIDFGVRLYVREANNLEPVFPYGGSDWDNGALRYFATIGSVPNSGPFPDVVDVMVRILTNEGAQLIANLEEGNGPTPSNFDEAWWEIAEDNSHVFTQRIYINTRPL